MKALLLMTLMITSAQSLAAAKNELPFHQPVTLKKVVMNKPMKTNLLASYKEFHGSSMIADRNR